jgi:hypothetical protein
MKAAAIEQQIDRTSAERESRDVGLDEGHLLVKLARPGERRSR